MKNSGLHIYKTINPWVTILLPQGKLDTRMKKILSITQGSFVEVSVKKYGEKNSIFLLFNDEHLV